jgi:hypothetical protein
MATPNNITPASRFHNLSDAALADEIGRVDAAVKGAEAQLTLLKNEFKARNIDEVAGEQFTVTATNRSRAASTRKL